MLTTIEGAALVAAPSSIGAGAMIVKILKQTVCAREVVRAGDIVTAPEHDARYLIALGFAEPRVEEKQMPDNAPVHETPKTRKTKNA